MTSGDKKFGMGVLALASVALFADRANSFPMPSSDAKTLFHATHVVRVATSHYKDGVYTATGQYGHGPSFLTVTVTLSADIVTAVQIQTPAKNPTSLDYQRRFAAAVPAVVLGKPLASIKVGRLAGSSGTPDGFNAALAQIKQQAAE